MNGTVQRFLEENEKVRRAELEKKKKELLFDLDICEKEYMPPNYQGDRSIFAFADVDKETQQYRFYRKVFPQITDEEYDLLRERCKERIEQIERQREEDRTKREKLLEDCKSMDQDDERANPWVVSALRGFGWSDIIFGVISAIFVGIYTESFWFGLGVFFAAFVSGVLFLALGEIVYLLMKIKDRKI